MAAQPIFKHFDHGDVFWGAEGAAVFLIEAVGLSLLVTRIRMVKVVGPRAESDPATAGLKVALLTAPQFAAQQATLQAVTPVTAPVGVNVGYTPAARCYAIGGGATDWYQNTPGQTAKIAVTPLSTGGTNTVDVTFASVQQTFVAAGSVLSLIVGRNHPALEDIYDFEIFLTEG